MTNSPDSQSPEPNAETLPSQMNEIQALIEQSAYAQVIGHCQKLIEADPTEKLPYWYLGLALLLVGQEMEAQMVWLEAIDTDDSEQLEQWSEQLWQVLAQEADRRTELVQTGLEQLAQLNQNPASQADSSQPSPVDSDATNAPDPAALQQEQQITWAIRQHMRELAPNVVNNLLQILQLSIDLGLFTGEEPSELGLIELLEQPESIIQPVDPQLLQQTLHRLLKIAPVHPHTLAFTSAVLSFSEERDKLADMIIRQAVLIAHTDRQPQQAALLAELCLQVPNSKAEALRHLASFYLSGYEYDRSIEAAEAYYAMQTDLAEKAMGNHLALQARMKAGGYWQEALKLADRQTQLLEKLVTEYPTNLDRISAIRLFSANFFPPYLHDQPEANRQISNRLAALCQANVRNYASDLATKFEQGHTERAKRIGKGDRPPQRRLKIGYLSHHFFSHSVGWLSRWLFAEHDRENFEIFTYFILYKSHYDVVQDFIEQSSEHVRKLDANSRKIAEQIYADDIDILIDLDSITLDVTCEIMALKPAPIQATWLGMDASGMPAIDYFIADPYILPAEADRYYHEKIWRLPRTFLAIEGFGMAVPTIHRRDLNIPAASVVYLSSQIGYKRHPDHARSQMQIIKAVPNSYFLIKGFADQNTVQKFFYELADQEGVERDRLIFLANTSLEIEHRANLAIADVVLDTFPYNGATTTMETLWAGVPIVTRVGQQFAARNSYSMLVNAGIEAGIAWSDQEYIDWGIRLGSDRQLHQKAYSQLQKGKNSAPLWNTHQFVQDLEQAYLGMWAEHCGGD
ncbi:TPR repeat-containing protein [Thalassoporum mexicanum PCC 7367]|uniref:O-linked N-acetylglucosamine transferase, SPINDLY family protein n=1 Tax=Thalassoporum mexicanum TaxID=3457544 RepID=UPI00029FF07F|nr:hypothetical protein [Pseudanabaena sp. PCC 7367]AFY69532.1 TPR repeat-containing protein [Pseudanabaena sp. PCC 7367]